MLMRKASALSALILHTLGMLTYTGMVMWVVGDTYLTREDRGGIAFLWVVWTSFQFMLVHLTDAVPALRDLLIGED